MRELALLFLKLGTVGFGGPAAHIALMEHEVVRRRRWLTRQEFLDLIGATNLIPGPNSTELAIHIGRLRAGRAGLVTAGVAFILPAAAIVAAVAWAYQEYGTLPEFERLLYGVKPVVLAVVVQALAALGRTALKNGFAALVAIATTTAVFSGVHELAVLATSALAGVLVAWRRSARPALAWLAAAAGGYSSALIAASAAAAHGTAVSLGTLALVFVKAGALLFGSGYVLLAFLRADLVERLHWLSDAQLLDAIAVGQMTPGPVFTTATFVGYVLAGWPGAVIATVAIFAPAFLFVALSAPLVDRLRGSPTTASLLDAVNAASLALMAAVTVKLGSGSLSDPTAGAIFAGALVLLVYFRVNSALLVAAGGIAGLILPP